MSRPRVPGDAALALTAVWVSYLHWAQREPRPGRRGNPRGGCRRPPASGMPALSWPRALPTTLGDGRRQRGDHPAWGDRRARPPRQEWHRGPFLPW